MLETNSATVELVTTLTVHVLVEGRDILLDVFRNEDIAKGVLVGVTHVEPRSVYALNETTFLVTYLPGYWLMTLALPLRKLINGWVNQ